MNVETVQIAIDMETGNQLMLDTGIRRSPRPCVTYSTNLIIYHVHHIQIREGRSRSPPNATNPARRQTKRQSPGQRFLRDQTPARFDLTDARPQRTFTRKSQPLNINIGLEFSRNM